MRICHLCVQSCVCSKVPEECEFQTIYDTTSTFDLEKRISADAFEFNEAARPLARFLPGQDLEVTPMAISSIPLWQGSAAEARRGRAVHAGPRARGRAAGCGARRGRGRRDLARADVGGSATSESEGSAGSELEDAILPDEEDSEYSELSDADTSNDGDADTSNDDANSSPETSVQNKSDAESQTSDIEDDYVSVGTAGSQTSDIDEDDYVSVGSAGSAISGEELLPEPESDSAGDDGPDGPEGASGPAGPALGPVRPDESGPESY